MGFISWRYLISCSWQKQSKRFRRSIEINPVDTNIVYAGTTSIALKSIDGGYNWNEIPGIIGSWTRIIKIDNFDPSHILIGISGIPLIFYESFDFGANWSLISIFPPDENIALHTFEFWKSSNEILVGTNKGLFFITLP